MIIDSHIYPQQNEVVKLGWLTDHSGMKHYFVTVCYLRRATEEEWRNEIFEVTGKHYSEKAENNNFWEVSID